MRRSLALAALVLATTAHAQLVPPDPDWRETAPPPPPALRTDRLIPLEMPASSLRWGVDPDSITIGQDQVVRYVVVATGPQALTALYEGLRCQSGEVKVYMRHNGSDWQPVSGSEWRPIRETPGTRHSWQIARSGACSGRSAALSPREAVRLLRNGPDIRDTPRF